MTREERTVPDSSGGSLVFGSAETPGPRSLVKRAFLVDGTPIAGGTTVPSGTIVRFLLDVDDDTGGTVSDVSVQDVLAASFTYQAGVLVTDDTLASSAVCPGGACDEAAIFAQVDGAGTPIGDGDAVTPPIDADAGSFDGSATVDFGDEKNPNNARLDIPADRVWAALVTVRVQ